MEILENGAIVGNYKKEKWETVVPGIEQFKVSGDNLTLCFVRIGPERCGRNAPTPKGHVHDDVEQMTILLKGEATVILNGKRYPVRRGAHWYAPPGIDHGLDLRESPDGVTILQIFPRGERPAMPQK